MTSEEELRDRYYDRRRAVRCKSCGEESTVIEIDIHGDWPAKWVEVTACCESDFEECR